jgi:pimeloyl-ACP methyl ester carboxylesterase
MTDSYKGRSLSGPTYRPDRKVSAFCIVYSATQKQRRHRHFDKWGECYLDSDSGSRTRTPAAVKVPAGPFNDILRAWHGDLGYDPAMVQIPVALIRGEWDGVVPDEDARWLFDAFKASPVKRDIKISRGTHLMHLEAMRAALYRETNTFLLGEDQAISPQGG